MSFEVYAIRFATNPARLRGQNFIADADPLRPHTMDFFCWLLVHDAEAIMVDTGTTRESVEHHGYNYVRCPTDAVAALGFDPATIGTVILTHLHYDHIGNVGKFPSAQFTLPAAEMAYATGPDMALPFMRRAYAAADTARVIERLYEGRVTLHGDALELRPGLSVHVLGGHTFGQAVVRVETKRGAVVLASDVLHYYEELERGVPFAVAQDITAMLRAHAVVRRLADSEDHIIPAHDPLVLERYPTPRPELAGVVVRLDEPPRRG